MAKNEDIKFFLKSTKEQLLTLHHSVCGVLSHLWEFDRISNHSKLI